MGRRSRAVYDPTIAAAAMDETMEQTSLFARDDNNNNKTNGTGNDDFDPLAMEYGHSMHGSGGTLDIRDPEYHAIMMNKKRGNGKSNLRKWLSLTGVIVLLMVLVIVLTTTRHKKGGSSESAATSTETTGGSGGGENEPVPGDSITLTSPSSDLRTFCALDNVRTVTGWDQCQTECAVADCCKILPVNFSCQPNNVEVCQEYNDLCQVLLQVSAPNGTNAEDTTTETTTTSNADLILTPPSQGLVTVCSPDNVKTTTGREQCQTECSLADCCNVLPVSQSCLSKNADVCMEYEDVCAVLMTDADNNGVPDQEQQKNQGNEVTTLDDPPANLGQVCADDQLVTKEGRQGCQMLCDAAACCDVRMSDPNSCQLNSHENCNIYRANCFALKQILDAVQNGLPNPPDTMEYVCSASNLETYQGKNECQELCNAAACCGYDISDPASCQSSSSEACQAYSKGCAALEEAKKAAEAAALSNPTDTRLAPLNLTDTCSSARLQYGEASVIDACTSQCSKAACCVDAGENSCVDDFDLCDSYSVCFTHAVLKQQYSDVAGYVNGKCDESKMSQDDLNAIMVCEAVCKDALCCFWQEIEKTDPDAAANCQGVDPALCPYYEGCAVLLKYQDQVDQADATDGVVETGPEWSDFGTDAVEESIGANGTDAGMDGDKDNGNGNDENAPPGLFEACDPDKLENADEDTINKCVEMCKTAECCLEEGDASCIDTDLCDDYDLCFTHAVLKRSSTDVKAMVDSKCNETLMSMDNLEAVMICEEICEDALCCFWGEIEKDDPDANATCDSLDPADCALYEGCRVLMKFQDLVDEIDATDGEDEQGPEWSDFGQDAVEQPRTDGGGGGDGGGSDTTVNGDVIAEPKGLKDVCGAEALASSDATAMDKCIDMCKTAECCLEIGSASCIDTTLCDSYELCFTHAVLSRSNTDIEALVNSKCKESLVTSDNLNAVKVCQQVCEDALCCFWSQLEKTDPDAAMKCEGLDLSQCSVYQGCSILLKQQDKVDQADATDGIVEKGPEWSDFGQNAVEEPGTAPAGDGTIPGVDGTTPTDGGSSGTEKENDDEKQIRAACSAEALQQGTEAVTKCTEMCKSASCCFETGEASCIDTELCDDYDLCFSHDILALQNTDIKALVASKCNATQMSMDNLNVVMVCEAICEDALCCFWSEIEQDDADATKECTGIDKSLCDLYDGCRVLLTMQDQVDQIDATDGENEQGPEWSDFGQDAVEQAPVEGQTGNGDSDAKDIYAACADEKLKEGEEAIAKCIDLCKQASCCLETGETSCIDTDMCDDYDLCFTYAVLQHQNTDVKALVTSKCDATQMTMDNLNAVMVCEAVCEDALCCFWGEIEKDDPDALDECVGIDKDLCTYYEGCRVLLQFQDEVDEVDATDGVIEKGPEWSDFGQDAVEEDGSMAEQGEGSNNSNNGNGNGSNNDNGNTDGASNTNGNGNGATDNKGNGNGATSSVASVSGPTKDDVDAACKTVSDACMDYCDIGRCCAPSAVKLFCSGKTPSDCSIYASCSIIW